MEYKTIRKPDPATYFAVFEKTTPGEQILVELKGLFYDRPSYVRGDPYDTAFNEGQRSVLEFILRKMVEGEQDKDSPTTFEAIIQGEQP